MERDNLQKNLVTILKSVLELKHLKTTSDYETVTTKIDFKGETTGTIKTLEITLDENDDITYTGNFPYIDIVKEMVNKFLSETNFESVDYD